MPPLTLFMLSISMSADAFAVAVGRGAGTTRGRLGEAVRTGLIFGAVEAVTPFLGWLAGRFAAGWIAEFDHWIAFGLLFAVGLNMIRSAFASDQTDDASHQAFGPSLLVLLATAVGTSIDAMAVGLSLALIEVDLGGILIVCAGVGITTAIFAFGGMLLGRMIGAAFGRLAEIVAGLVLCTIGVMILVEHLFIG